MNQASTPTIAETRPQDDMKKRLRLRLTMRDMGTLIGLIVICAMFAVLSD